jgi:hypothetical protein
MTFKKFFPALLLAGVLVTQPASGKVFLKVSQGELPPARAMGVSDLVFVWPVGNDSLLNRANALGYHVFLEAAPGDLSLVADAAEKANAVGVIFDAGNLDSSASEDVLRSAQSAHSKLSFLLLTPGGKEPQMKARLVVERDGILQVSSPTSQPWVDSNLALVRFARAFRPGAIPLYTFHWNLSDAVRKKLGPTAEDYSLAIAEADAFHADVILDLHEGLQRGLAHNEAEAWTLWNHVKRHIALQRAENDPGMLPLANTGIVTNDYRVSYEGINLMARHNIPFVVLRPVDLEAKRLDALDMLVVFSGPSLAACGVLGDFAKQGGIVVLVNLRGDFPWHSSEPIHRNAQSAVYSVGTGQIVELAEPVIDPEVFSRDMRRLMGVQRSSLSLWNSLTTIAVPYRKKPDGETLVNLVNYALEPEPVQVQIKGHFSSILYESPERGCCQSIPPIERDGFTEFVIPALIIGGRVHLKSTITTPQR